MTALSSQGTQNVMAIGIKNMSNEIADSAPRAPTPTCSPGVQAFHPPDDRAVRRPEDGMPTPSAALAEYGASERVSVWSPPQVPRLNLLSATACQAAKMRGVGGGGGGDREGTA